MTWFKKHYITDACRNLFSARLRSFLALLGIWVGSAAVVTLLTAGKLATDAALDAFKTLGTDLMAISIYADGQGTQSKLTWLDWDVLSKSSAAIKWVAPYTMTYAPMSTNGYALDGVVVAGTESLVPLLKLSLQEGRFISDVYQTERYAVVGAEIADSFKSRNGLFILGQQIKIQNMIYTVIGVLNPTRENGFFNENLNRAVIIPLGGIGQLVRDISIANGIIQLTDGKETDNVNDSLNARLALLYPSMKMYVRSSKEIIRSMEHQNGIFTSLLLIIGSISLLVGGVGIMNIMLVAVTERKTEIGLRKALGATRKDIILLFLTEAVLLTFSGGLMGGITGEILAWILSIINGWHFTILIWPLFLGVVIAVLTGLFFGYYPAKKAAMMEPAACLRNES